MTKIIAITGTSSGLGAEIARFYTIKGWKVFDLNRPYFDITEPNMSIIPDFDVFVNNAYDETDGFAQTDLLYKVYEQHKDRECMIISVGSVSGDGDRHKVYPYGAHKSVLEKASIQLSLVENPCKVCIIKPGRMHTPMTEHRKEYYRMPPSDVVKAIDFMIEQPKSITIKSLTVDVHNANRKNEHGK
jgi:NADP-dependent 3-hydroxy acid dehydrogenase YdfG